MKISIRQPFQLIDPVGVEFLRFFPFLRNEIDIFGIPKKFGWHFELGEEFIKKFQR